jgi:hypothetical protein
VDTLPCACDLSRVGLNPSDIKAVTLLRRRPGHGLFRIHDGNRSLVLKWFADATHAVEPRAYELLARLAVPTLPIHGHTAQSLLLEDLAVSPTWRLATEADVSRPTTGIAVANWYRTLHEAGLTFLADGRAKPDWLRRETDDLNPATIQQAGKRLDLIEAPGWRLAMDRIGELQQAIHAMPTTLVYGDFHWTNLALTRNEPCRAIVFDYHLLGIGPRASDYRNVCGSLDTSARSAFQSGYGQVDEREAALDAPMATLHALQIAADRPSLPSWSGPLIHEVRNGDFEMRLGQALACL